MKVVDYDTYVDMYKELPIKGIENVKAFYNHTLKVFCTDPHALFISLDDHLVHRGDAVFESMTCRNRKIVKLDNHLKRLVNSLKAISLTLPISMEELKKYIVETARIGNFDNGSIRLLLGRGRGGFDVDPFECPEASIYIIASEQQPKDDTFWNKGLSAIRSHIPTKQQYLAKIKSTNYLPNVLMALEARKENANLAFSFDEHGYLAESAICNVAIVKEGTFYFPKFDNILSGTTALLSIEQAKKIGKVELANISEEMLKNADEVLAIGSTIACASVTSYEHKKIGNGEVGIYAKKLRELILLSYEEDGQAY